MHKRARGQELDPLSAASAGLFARGIKGNRRSEVLELLSAMLDLADAEGTVALDDALYATEQRLGVNYCLEASTWLEELGVVIRTCNGWAIPAFALHLGPDGNTMESMQVLQLHLAALRSDSTEETEIVALPIGPADPSLDPRVVVPMKRWRRTVPMAAAGIAASIAVVAGVSQIVPQAAVSGRDAALHADAPTSVVAGASGALRSSVPAVAGGATSTSVAAGSPTSAAAAPSTGGLLNGVVCVAPRVLTAITSVEIVALPLAGDDGQTIWVAVVKGTTTLTDTETAVLLPGLSVVGHVIDGDTEAVLATLGAPLLVPDQASAFSAVISLGSTKPTTAVTATATPTGLKTCP
ncbi:MAG: hypothetical protein H0U92_13995 [Actinobacteria bacterium]|nr:hypothetical protein [Actinomycetota bacterium]